MDKGIIQLMQSKFDGLIQGITEENIEFWFARDLMEPLGYARWENFLVAINRAIDSCKSTGTDPDDHFRGVTKMVDLGSKAKRKIDDFMLTRYACYLIAQNGDPRKEEIAFAQSYFAIQTRKQELIEDRMRLQARLDARERLKESEKALSRNIYERGVDDAGFNHSRKKSGHRNEAIKSVTTINWHEMRTHMKQHQSKKRSAPYLIILLFCSLTGYLAAQNNNAPANNQIQKTYNTSSLDWKLWGFSPESFRTSQFIPNPKRNSEVRGIPATVPGSVQMALKNAGIIKDWNIGLNHNDCEWVENRSWLFSVKIPDEWIRSKKTIRLVCKGLDDNGFILINSLEAGQFNNTHIPYTFDITPFLKDNDNTLEIAFNPPPRYLGVPTYASKIKDWKPRFYYVWDWMPRNVQIGIWDDIQLEISDKDIVSIENLKVLTQADKIKEIGELKLSAAMDLSAIKGKLSVRLIDTNGNLIINEMVPCTQIRDGKVWNNLKIKRWWPNGQGDQTLYQLACTLYDETGAFRQEISQRIGFKNISWEANKDAPAGADPWLCVVNNTPIFLQGVNWTPIRPNFADLREADYRKLLTTYKELGANVFRVWGGAKIEKDWFYDLCDELGFLLWQEFPLSSGGYDNYPPESPDMIQTASVIARSYVKRIQNHVSLLLWCGGNELYEFGDKAMVTDKHPMIRSLKEIVMAEDPGRRFVPGSPSGINIWEGLDNFGKGINWDVHGPWVLPFTETDKTMAAVENFWKLDDALMHSEVGVGGCSSAALINKYRGNLNALPANQDNPLWNPFSWWIEWDDYLREHQGKAPASLEEYVQWSQDRQAQGLAIGLKACKKRFPGCGGFIIWMGHDSYPCTANTSIIDFDGNLKPAAIEVSKIWKMK